MMRATDECAAEPIHIPAAIQPHGALLTLRASDLKILQVSDNVRDFVSLEVDALLGRTVDETLGAELGALLRHSLATRDEHAHATTRIELGGHSLDALLHTVGGLVVLELETTAEGAPAFGAWMRRALMRLQRCRNLADLANAVAGTVRELTGFERVLMYRFDREGHGSVIAEAVDEAHPRYLGLHYPASDIPPQARALYLRNWLRLIPNARYTPSRLVPPRLPETDAPLDMSDCALRSVSPVHLEYMQNMGHVASMSISIVVAGKLWGLISCAHHSGPHHVRLENRAFCELIGRIVSLQIEALEAVELRALREARMAALLRLESAMRHGREDVLFAALREPEVLLELVAAAGAAVVNDDRFGAVGRHPGEAAVRQLLAWLKASGQGELFVSSNLSASYPEAARFASDASGVIAIVLPGESVRAALLFRPEVLQTVDWAGEPTKITAGSDARLHPRQSFARWRQLVRGCSAPFEAGEVELALDLRRRIMEVDLGCQVERERKAVRARDDLVAVVSHDLRNPLNVVQMQASLLLGGMGASGEPTRRLRASAERIQRAVNRMNSLIQDLLDLAKIEAGRFIVEGTAQSPQEIVNEALMVMQPLAEQRSIELRVDVASSPPVVADRDRIYQVLANLIGNALKFTSQGGTVRLRVRPQDGQVVFSIIDDGPGIPEDTLPHLFDRYWQARRTAKLGTGLGLFIARGIVEAHRGKIWVDSEVGHGSAFHFSLPTYH
jgi:two-component system, chemotaxis family, sensor kinase Cph1